MDHEDRAGEAIGRALGLLLGVLLLVCGIGQLMLWCFLWEME